MENRSIIVKFILGVQMLFVAFGALVLVPILTGLDPCVALFTAGLGTILFQVVTGFSVPVFLASSFAFIAPLSYIVTTYGKANPVMGIRTAGGAIIACGLTQIVISLIIWKFGMKTITKYIPPIVIGPTIMAIGLKLAPVAVDMAKGKNTNIPYKYAIIIAMISLLTAIFISIKGKGVFKLLPIIGGITAGYVVSIGLGIVKFNALSTAVWFKVPDFHFPVFNMEAILFMLPVIIAPTIEHIGDIAAISNIAGKDFLTKPGLHRTLAGDGIASTVAGLFGGPPNTTYSEVSGALALIKVCDPVLMTIAAGSAISLSFIGKINALLKTIPVPVLGGIMILLFGMIASIGIQTLVKNKVDFSKNRNLVIASVILVVGIGNLVLDVGYFQIGGIGLAGLCGVILNLIIPEEK